MECPVKRDVRHLQDFDRIRAAGYPPSPEQRGAFAKLFRQIVDAFPEIPWDKDALAVLEDIEANKRRVRRPKEGKPK